MNSDLTEEEFNFLVEKAMHDTQSREDLLRRNDEMIDKIKDLQEDIILWKSY